MASTRKLSQGGKGVETYPTARAYFDELPDGWASFPGSFARASLLGKLRERGALDTLDALPAALRPILDHLSTNAEWLPEVVHVATLLAVRDAQFGNTPHADAFLDWTTQLNRELLGGPQHAETLSVARPADLVPLMPALWETFHVGSPLTVVEHGATRAGLALAHPRQLFDALFLESLRRVCALLLAQAGAVQPLVVARTVVGDDERRTVFEMSWR